VTHRKAPLIRIFRSSTGISLQWSAARYAVKQHEVGDFQKANQHVSSPGKTGIVFLKVQPGKEGVWKLEPLERELSHRRSRNRH
jgi:hypothetical protein